MQKIQRAFTLFDLLVSILILSVLFSLAMPGLGSALQAQAGDALIGDLARTLNQARAAAVSSGSRVTLCRSRDGFSCGGSWIEGMVLFTDSNGNRTVDGFDQLLRSVRLSGRAGAGTLRLRSFPNRQYVQFTALGHTHKQNGSFTWCPPGNDAARAQQLIFTQAGRVRIAQDRSGDGIREDANGNPLVCP